MDTKSRFQKLSPERQTLLIAIASVFVFCVGVFFVAGVPVLLLRLSAILHISAAWLVVPYGILCVLGLVVLTHGAARDYE